jgi:hypothetical protein
MNRIALFGFAAAFSGLALAVPGAEARLRSVLHGAMDICKIEGDSWVEDGVERCCTDNANETDDGVDVSGQPYCVYCVQGTETCYMEDGTARPLTPAKFKELMKITPKQGTVTGN